MMSQKEKVETKSSTKFPELILGRILLEIIKEDSVQYKKQQYGMENSIIELAHGEIDPSTGQFKAFNSVPYSKGIIIKMAKSAFGERFQYYYGKEDLGSTPQIGDTVMFIPNQSYRVDPAGKYHIITDEHIIGYFKGE